MAYVPNKYNGLRKLTIVMKQGGQTKTSVILGNQLGQDGLNLQASPVELTTDTQEGQDVTPVGVSLKAATISLVPLSVEDKGKMLPMGWDETTGTWNMFSQSCDMQDCTLAYEKVCPNSDGSNGVNVIVRHCPIAIAHNVQLRSNNPTVLSVSVFPHMAPATDYGLSGDAASKDMAWQEYMGTYDPSTDKVKFDKAPGK